MCLSHSLSSQYLIYSPKEHLENNTSDSKNDCAIEVRYILWEYKINKRKKKKKAQVPKWELTQIFSLQVQYFYYCPIYVK